MDDETEEQTEPQFSKGSRVSTPEGVYGTVRKVHPSPNLDMGEHEYTVEWDDGVTDRQDETLFREASIWT